MIGCDAKLLDEFAGSNKTAESQDSQVFSWFFSLICSYEFISGVSGWGSSQKPTFFFFLHPALLHKAISDSRCLDEMMHCTLVGRLKG